MNPRNILDSWLNAINHGNIEQAIALYDKNAVLIPTFSNRILTTPELRRGYFEKLATREDLSIALHANTVTIQPVNDHLYTINGIYNWRFNVEGEILNFEARFSFLLDMQRPSPIIHHHSSQVPRML